MTFQLASTEGDLERQLKAWRRDLEARKTVTASILAGRSLPEADTATAVSDAADLLTPLRSLDFEGLGASDGGSTGLSGFAAPRLGEQSQARAPRPSPLFLSSGHSSPARPGDDVQLRGFLGATASLLEPRQPHSPERPIRPSDSILGPGALLRSSREAQPSSTLQEAQEKRLLEVRRALAEREKELRELDSPDASHSESGDDIWTGHDEDAELVPEELHQLRDELATLDASIAALEERLRQQGGSNWLAASQVSDEAPSDSSTAASNGPPLSESQWSQRAQALEQELRSQSSAAMEIQDRIHWLRAQLRRQPSLEDPRVAAIRDMLLQIANQAQEMAAYPGVNPQSQACSSQH